MKINIASIVSLLSLGAAGLALGQDASGETGGTGQSFIPDTTFKGSSLSGWQKVGQADWRARDGELTGTVKAGGAGGLLIGNQSFQDVEVHAMFKTVGDSEAGIVLRTEKTTNGWKGVLVSSKDGVVGVYGATFDAAGKELMRAPLRPIGGTQPLVRIAPRGTPNTGAEGEDAAPAAGGRGRGGRGGAGGARRGGGGVIPRPDSSFHTNEWNQIEVVLDVNILRAFLNDSGGPSGAVDDVIGRFGAVALYLGGPGEAHFKDVGLKDVGFHYTPPEQSSARFRVQRISDMYYSWSAAVADFNKDGKMDIVAGPYIYYGPDFTKYREIYPGVALNPSKDFTGVNCQYAFDWNGDGWPDVLTGPPVATLYINPKGESRRWDKYEVLQGNISSEVTVTANIDKSGIPALVYCRGGFVCYAKPDPADATKKWVEHQISEAGMAYGHGIGAGDINGDGRMDILNPLGWWEQPAAGPDSGPWTYHPEAFGRFAHRSAGPGGSVMAVYDVNGDGLNDVVTSLNAHGFGLAWFEQKRDKEGKISFVRHMIMDDFSTKNAGDVTFSELHGSTFADIDGDGIPDFIVGKRYWSHLDTWFDPDGYGAPVLYVFRTVRNKNAPGGAEFVPELVHNRSGAGSDVTAADLNGDGAVDIITSTDRGTFIFWNNKLGPGAVKAR